jgi:hypothetical protein
MQTYKIFAYNKEKREYAHLGEARARTQFDALHDWASENPKRFETIEAIPDVKVIALLEGGGI